MVEAGSSGNKVSKRAGGDAARDVCILDSFTLGPGTEETDARRLEAALAADQGVFL